jgi:DNA-binding protein Fis
MTPFRRVELWSSQAFMKRVVTFVMPMAGTDSPEAVAAGITFDQSTQVAVDPSESGATGSGTMKVEAIVTDEQAQRILAAVLSNGAATERGPAKEDWNGFDTSLEEIVRKEQAVHEPQPEGLLERIVLHVERHLILQVYSECEFVKSRAAARLGINRNTLLKKLRQFGELAEGGEVMEEPTERI